MHSSCGHQSKLPENGPRARFLHRTSGKVYYRLILLYEQTRMCSLDKRLAVVVLFLLIAPQLYAEERPTEPGKWHEWRDDSMQLLRTTYIVPDTQVNLWMTFDSFECIYFSLSINSHDTKTERVVKTRIDKYPVQDHDIGKTLQRFRESDIEHMYRGEIGKYEGLRLTEDAERQPQIAVGKFLYVKDPVEKTTATIPLGPLQDIMQRRMAECISRKQAREREEVEQEAREEEIWGGHED